MVLAIFELNGVTAQPSGVTWRSAGAVRSNPEHYQAGLGQANELLPAGESAGRSPRRRSKPRGPPDARPSRSIQQPIQSHSGRSLPDGCRVETAAGHGSRHPAEAEANARRAFDQSSGHRMTPLARVERQAARLAAGIPDPRPGGAGPAGRSRPMDPREPRVPQPGRSAGCRGIGRIRSSSGRRPRSVSLFTETLRRNPYLKLDVTPTCTRRKLRGRWRRAPHES